MGVLGQEPRCLFALGFRAVAFQDERPHSSVCIGVPSPQPIWNTIYPFFQRAIAERELFWFHACLGERSPSREHSGVYGIAFGLSHIRTCHSWPEDALGTSVGF